MDVVTKSLSELHEIAKNVRKHTDKQLKEYVRSLQMFGQIKPIVIDEYGEIIAGNGLYAALKSMGAETCECYVVAGLTATQKKKLMLADMSWASRIRTCLTRSSKSWAATLMYPVGTLTCWKC